MPIYVFIFAVICLLFVVVFMFIHSRKRMYTYNYQFKQPIVSKLAKIPSIVHLTCKDKASLPEKVVRQWQELNPAYTVEVHDDSDCVTFLREEYGPDFVDLFGRIPDGPIKSDFWRICYLYKRGGVYSDIDNIPVLPISEIIPDNTSFCLPFSTLPIPIIPKANPMFIACVPGCPIIGRMLELYINATSKRDYSYWGYSIMFVADHVLNSTGTPYLQGSYDVSDGCRITLLPEKLFEFAFPLRKHAGVFTLDGRLAIRNRDETYDHINHRFH